MVGIKYSTRINDDDDDDNTAVQIKLQHGMILPCLLVVDVRRSKCICSA